MLIQPYYAEKLYEQYEHQITKHRQGNDTRKK